MEAFKCDGCGEFFTRASVRKINITLDTITMLDRRTEFDLCSWLCVKVLADKEAKRAST